MSEVLLGNTELSEPYKAVVNALAGPGWGVFPNFLPRNQVGELARECRALWDAGGFRQAGIGNGPGFHLNNEIRTDRVMWLNDDLLTPIQRRWTDVLDDLRLAINRHLYLGLHEFEGHFAVYPPGTFYKRHLDQFKGIGLRTVTAILYLNEDWTEADGGKLRLYLETGEDSPYVDVMPEAGTLVSFLSASFIHEVLPSNRERMSLTGWYRKRV